MRYVLDGGQMKQVDKYSIEEIKIPSMVLMERAALSVARYIKKQKGIRTVLCVCGYGNNGADGVAVARILAQWGFLAKIYTVGNPDSATREFRQQLEIAMGCGVQVTKRPIYNDYDVIVDAMFGVGLSRELQGIYANTVRRINESGRYIVAVDIPSGISSYTGQVLGTAVKANVTVTFGAYKNGLLLNQGREYAGQVIVGDAGFPVKAFDRVKKKGFILEKKDVKRLPKRPGDGNKGTFGKVFVIAGSENMSGAAVMSVSSAYRCGAGLVKLITHIRTGETVRKVVPEALVTTYDNNTGREDLVADIMQGISWCDIVIIGPGISLGPVAELMVETVMKNCDKPVICDADAITILAANRELIRQRRCSQLIVTPHVGEMSRLTGLSVTDIKAAPIETARTWSAKHKAICVLKDAVTVVADSNGEYYINTTGNCGMAKGGSGDVLTGVIAGLVENDRAANNALGLMRSVSLAVYIHGLAGDMAAQDCGKYGMLPQDMIKKLLKIMKE